MLTISKQQVTSGQVQFSKVTSTTNPVILMLTSFCACYDEACLSKMMLHISATLSANNSVSSTNSNQGQHPSEHKDQYRLASVCPDLFSRNSCNSFGVLNLQKLCRLIRRTPRPISTAAAFSECARCTCRHCRRQTQSQCMPAK